VVGGYGGKRQQTLESRRLWSHTPGLGRYPAEVGVSVVDFVLKHAADGTKPVGGNWAFAECKP
jgi:hypothetical protein